MSRTIAFLRAINVGGHTVRMEELRAHFAGLGLEGVESFIASGNVIFATPEDDPAALEARVEASLRAWLGYPVAVFTRTAAELGALAAYRAFPPAELEKAAALNVALLKTALGDAAVQKLMGLRTEIDDFAFHGREIYWRCLKKQSESTFSNAALEKNLGVQSTLRGLNTLQKMAQKYPV